MRRLALVLLASLAPLVAQACLTDSDDDCAAKKVCADPGAGAGPSVGPGGMAGAGGDGGAGAGATGGGGSGGVGGEPMCTSHADCTDAENAQCDDGTCVPCGDPSHCDGVADADICDDGTCVQCLLGDEDACVSPQTCDLIAKACVDVGPMTVQNCKACSNDSQCVAGHRCIAMDFNSMPHGHYCLEVANPGCMQPFSVFINKPSISEATAVNYCGLEEDLATCEAVQALVLNWRCTGTAGMCSETMGGVEVPVAGALCEPVGALGDRCTYACAGPTECPDNATQGTCGDGDNTPPGWCGG